MESRPGTSLADQPQPEVMFNDQLLSETPVQPIAAFSSALLFDNNNVPLMASPPHQPLSGIQPLDQQPQRGHTLHSTTGLLMAPSGGASLSRVACTECRSRHLKCDAKYPKCSRCRDTGSMCIYTKSRRGWKGIGKKGRSACQGESRLSKELATSIPQNVDLATHDISNDLVGQCQVIIYQPSNADDLRPEKLTANHTPRSSPFASINFTFSGYFASLPRTVGFLSFTCYTI